MSELNPVAWRWDGIHSAVYSENNPFSADSPEHQKEMGVTPLYSEETVRNLSDEINLLKGELEGLSSAYLRIRGILNAFDTKYGPTKEEVWEHTETRLKEVIGLNGVGKMEKIMGKTEATVNVLVKMTLWQAIKIRISGIFKNAESFEQQGACIQIKYKA